MDFMFLKGAFKMNVKSQKFKFMYYSYILSTSVNNATMII
jgi:hypothetical protein